jgi:hypothetical protein
MSMLLDDSIIVVPVLETSYILNTPMSMSWNISGYPALKIILYSKIRANSSKTIKCNILHLS